MILVKCFCPLKIKITQFPGGLRRKFLTILPPRSLLRSRSWGGVLRDNPHNGCEADKPPHRLIHLTRLDRMHLFMRGFCCFCQVFLDFLVTLPQKNLSPHGGETSVPRKPSCFTNSRVNLKKKWRLWLSEDEIAEFMGCYEN